VGAAVDGAARTGRFSFCATCGATFISRNPATKVLWCRILISRHGYTSRARNASAISSAASAPQYRCTGPVLYLHQAHCGSRSSRLAAVGQLRFMPAALARQSAAVRVRLRFMRGRCGRVSRGNLRSDCRDRPLAALPAGPSVESFFLAGQASISVPSTLKCSSESSPAALAWSRISARTAPRYRLPSAVPILTETVGTPHRFYPMFIPRTTGNNRLYCSCSIASARFEPYYSTCSSNAAQQFLRRDRRTPERRITSG